MLPLLVLRIDLMKQYRKLDDTIVTKLNRANAARRDSNRTRGLPSYVHSIALLPWDTRADLSCRRSNSTEGQDDMCLALWQEMIGQSAPHNGLTISLAEIITPFPAGYEARQKLLTYCTGVVDDNLNSKRKAHVEAEGIHSRQSPVLGQFEEEVLVRLACAA